MTEVKYQSNPQTCAYLASLGIEVNRIPVDGWDAIGYQYVTGEGPMGDGSLPRERRTWPEGFDYQKMLELWAADLPTRTYHRGTTQV